MEWLERLASELCAVHLMDIQSLYDERNRHVVRAVWFAQKAGLPAGFRFDPKEPEWPVAYIELPTGQVSWHLPQHAHSWDGHTTEEKYRRVHDFAEGY